MPSRSNEWTFTEKERDKVCKGKMCPRCKSDDIKHVGCAPDGINSNNAFDCNSCGEQWEGY